MSTDRSHMRRIGLFLLLASGLLACASRAPDDRVEPLEGEEPTQAWVRDGAAVVRFDTDPGHTVYALARWPDTSAAVDDYAHLFARLEYGDNDWPDGIPSRREFTPVPVLPADRWEQLIADLIQELLQNCHLAVVTVFKREHQLTAELPTRRNQLLEVLLAGEPTLTAFLLVVGHEPTGFDNVVREFM